MARKASRLGASFFESPRTRRLERDLQEMKQLRKESTILDFRPFGDPPDRYAITFKGPRLVISGRTAIIDPGPGKVEIRLGTQYPVQLPDMRWVTPISHPNIFSGKPCLGSYVMSPRKKLTDLVELLWDFQRMALFGPEAETSAWVAIRQKIGFPIDPRILRDLSAPPPTCPMPEGDEPELIMEGSRLGLIAMGQHSGVKVVNWNPGRPDHLSSFVMLYYEPLRRRLDLSINTSNGKIIAINYLGCHRKALDAQEVVKGMPVEEVLGFKDYRIIYAEDLALNQLLDFVFEWHELEVPPPAQASLLDVIGKCFPGY